MKINRAATMKIIPDKKKSRSHLLTHYDHSAEYYAKKSYGPVQDEESDVIKLVGNSLFVFGPENCFRRVIGYIANSKLFNYFILLLIVISTLTLALDSPLEDPDG